MIQQRRVLIIGVNRGVGYQLAKELAGAGNQVWGSTRGIETDLELAGLLTLDLLDEASIVSAIAELASQTDAIDLLINCAGVDARAFGGADQLAGPFDLGAEMFTNVIRVNVTGPMVVTRELVGLLRNGTDPMIVNISSQLGSMEVGKELGQDTAYCVSKAALNMLSVKTAATLKSDGIALIMMHPGWVKTDMGGPGAKLTVEESVNAVINTISGLSIRDTGRFLCWDGSEHPW